MKIIDQLPEPLKKILVSCGLKDVTRLQLMSDMAKRGHFSNEEAILAIDAILANTPDRFARMYAILHSIKRNKEFQYHESAILMSELAERTPGTHVVFYQSPSEFAKNTFGNSLPGHGGLS